MGHKWGIGFGLGLRKSLKSFTAYQAQLGSAARAGSGIGQWSWRHGFSSSWQRRRTTPSAAILQEDGVHWNRDWSQRPRACRGLLVRYPDAEFCFKTNTGY